MVSMFEYYPANTVMKYLFYKDLKDCMEFDPSRCYVAYPESNKYGLEMHFLIYGLKDTPFEKGF